MIGEALPVVRQQAKAIFSLSKLGTSITAAQLTDSVALTQKLVETLEHLTSQQKSYVESVSKLGFLSMRVFLYLLFQGFCGKEDPEDPDVDTPEELEEDGMGMGDGAGGAEQNVTDQIEHQEQLEGLKDY